MWITKRRIRDEVETLRYMAYINREAEKGLTGSELEKVHKWKADAFELAADTLEGLTTKRKSKLTF